MYSDDGVMIPASYTSYVAPLCSWKLYTEVKNWKDLKHFETAYVVKPHNVNQLAQAQECFTFVHPNKAERIDNNRYKKFVFKVTESSTLHGFVGYFETVLYKDTILSMFQPLNIMTDI
jgi:protein arginine N-methyltransferase 5